MDVAPMPKIMPGDVLLVASLLNENLFEFTVPSGRPLVVDPL